MSKNKFEPDYAVPPGWTLKEQMEFLGMTIDDLSRKTGYQLVFLENILEGKAKITSITAHMLGKALCMKEHFIMNLERQYRNDLMRLKRIKIMSKWVDKEDIDMVERYLFSSQKGKEENDKKN